MKIKLKKLIKGNHPWIGQAIRDLDISRQTIIVIVRRGNKVLIPTGAMVLESGDTIILYSKKSVTHSAELAV